MRGHIEAAATNLLQPHLWLDAASNYTQPFSGDTPSCSQKPHSSGDPICVTFRSSQHNVVMRGMRGDDPQPMRLAATVQAPLRLRALLLRNFACSGQYVALSTSSTPPLYPGMLPSLMHIALVLWCVHDGLHFLADPQVGDGWPAKGCLMQGLQTVSMWCHLLLC